MYRRTFLSFYKLILEKVRFSPELFWKEYQKALGFLNTQERDELNQWIYNRKIKRKEPTKK